MKFAKTSLILLAFLAISVQGAITNNVGSVTDWTAVAQGTVAESATLDTSGHYQTQLVIQAFLDSTTAHTGTEFRIQGSANTTGDEDWYDITQFVALIGTANSEAITNNPLAASSTTITCASTTGYTAGGWRAIEDGTLANSELIFQVGLTTDTNITILDGTTNEHAQSTNMWNIAISRSVFIGAPANRVRVVVNNTYDSDGSTLNYKVRSLDTSGI